MSQGDECGGNIFNPFAFCPRHLPRSRLPLQDLALELRHWKKVAGVRHKLVRLEGSQEEHLQAAFDTLHRRHKAERPRGRRERPAFQGRCLRSLEPSALCESELTQGPHSCDQSSKRGRLAETLRSGPVDLAPLVLEVLVSQPPRTAIRRLLSKLPIVQDAMRTQQEGVLFRGHDVLRRTWAKPRCHKVHVFVSDGQAEETVGFSEL